MLDIKLIRENPGIVKESLQKRQDNEKIEMLEELVKKDKEWRELITEVEKLKNNRNKISQEISDLKKQGKDASKKIEEAASIPKKIKEDEEKVNALQERCNWILMRLPNILHETVPYGKDDSENLEIRKVGKPPKFKFQPKDHLTILEGLGLIDSERAAKVAGHGFFYLKGKLVLLDYAIMRYALDFMVKKGFVPIEPPLMLKRKPYEGVTDLTDFESVMYKIENEDLYMIATSEHPLVSMYMDETIAEKDLPIKMVGISPCFRKEVGAHNKYTKGLYRMHQFNKVEQIVICHPKDSWDIFSELQKNSELLYKSLGIPFRVVNICTGDIGIIASKKYDIEGWMADGVYRERGSCSNCTDYQARRLNIKYKEKDGQVPKGFAHTLNNTALATSRAMISILEVFQQKDGTVKIPKVLWKYTGFKVLEKE